MNASSTVGVKLSGDRKVGYCNRIALRRSPLKHAGAEGASGERRQSLRQKDRELLYGFLTRNLRKRERTRIFFDYNFSE